MTSNLYAHILTFVLLLFSGSAQAQLAVDAGDVQAYDLVFGGMTIGPLVVVADDCDSPPDGLTSGASHWTWTEGPQWPGAFAIEEANDPPVYSAHSWEVFENEGFILDAPEPLDELSLAPSDRFYALQQHDGFVFGGMGYLWIAHGSPRTATWLGLAEAVTGPLDPAHGTLRVGALFEPPAAASVEVVMAP